METDALVAQLLDGAKTRTGNDALVVRAVEHMAAIDARRAALIADVRSIGGACVCAALDALSHASPARFARVVHVLARAKDGFESAYDSTQSSAQGRADWDGSTTLSRDDVLAVSVALAPFALPLPGQLADALEERSFDLLELCRLRTSMARALAGVVERLAPNLAAVTGADVAAELVGAAGSLSALARMPANNVVVLGRRGLDRATTAHVGVLAMCDIAMVAPPEHARQAHRMLAAKAVLAARYDVSSPGNDGSYGRDLRAAIEARMAVLSGPLVRARDKAIPPPEAGPRKRRGGRRVRRLRERLAPTDVRRRAERLRFGVPEEEVVLGGEIVGLGTLVDGGFDADADPSIPRMRRHGQRVIRGLD